MLCNIDDTLMEDARRIFTFLCFVPRLLSVPELLEAIAIDTKEPKGLNRKRRLQNFDDILEICPGFIEVIDATTKVKRLGVDREKSRQIVRIAHFSIQEYLESERIRGSKAANHSLNKATARTEVAEACLLYWLEEDFNNAALDHSIYEAMPLAKFAAKSWYPCYQDAIVPATRLESLILVLFQRPCSYAKWANPCDYLVPWPPLHPIVSAAEFGLDRVLSELLKMDEMNTPSLPFESTSSILSLALAVALRKGYESTVQILIDAGAHLNGTPLIAEMCASRYGNKGVIQTLIEAVKDLDCEGGKYGKILRSFLKSHVPTLMRTLIEAGADVNAQSGGGWNRVASCNRLWLRRNNPDTKRCRSYLDGKMREQPGRAIHLKPEGVIVWDL